ncbi:ISAzo13-like element transposase-related protein, partial [Hyella patelloides]|uniref:ISAzo13-like element transposase-related protein n=1 Tax=Hyella patelloides TaxID=1982969 RepID=UPI003CCC8EBE
PDRTRFQREDKLLILCDAGGSNDYRRRLWKRQIQSVLADSLGRCSKTGYFG